MMTENQLLTMKKSRTTVITTKQIIDDLLKSLLYSEIFHRVAEKYSLKGGGAIQIYNMFIYVIIINSINNGSIKTMCMLFLVSS